MSGKDLVEALADMKLAFDRADVPSDNRYVYMTKEAFDMYCEVMELTIQEQQGCIDSGRFIIGKHNE